MNDFTTPIERLGGALRIKTVSPSASSEGKGRASGLGLWWTFIAALVLVGAIIVAIVQNSRHVRLHYLAWHANVSLVVVVLTTALLAVFLDEVGGLIWRRRRRSRLGRRSELEQLRTQQQPPGETPTVTEQPSPRPDVGALSGPPSGA
jgi:uncharacterized integral membrane protein